MSRSLRPPCGLSSADHSDVPVNCLLPRVVIRNELPGEVCVLLEQRAIPQHTKDLFRQITGIGRFEIERPLPFDD